MHPDSTQSLRRWTSLCALALIAATYRLWTPQTVFPQVPIFAVLCRAPAWLDWIGLATLLIGLFLSAFSRNKPLTQCGIALVIIATPILVLLDQHRFQPWAYQLFLFAVIWLLAAERQQMALMRWLIISVYFYSAIGKFDYEFLHSVGQQMLSAQLKLFGYDAANLSDWFRLVLVTFFPLFELVIAAGLAWEKSRRIAGFCAIGLHLSLIVILGPLGLNHRWGVLLWNTQFAVQAYLLFISKYEQLAAPEPTSRSHQWAHAGSLAIIAVSILMPLTERFGIWDHWPSWALYAPHSSRVRVEVTSQSLSRLPSSLQALCKKPTADDEDDSNWVVVPIEAWSLQSLDTPIYPQARFQLGVAKHIAAEINAEYQVRISVLGHANRFTGLRQSVVLQGSDEIEQSGAIYWLNTRPRSPSK